MRRMALVTVTAAVAAGAGLVGGRLDAGPTRSATTAVDATSLDRALAAPVETCGRRCAPARPTLTLREAVGSVETTIYLSDPAAFRDTDGKKVDYLVPVVRRVPAADRIGGALAAVFAGPTPAESARGLRGAPWPGAHVTSWRLHGGILDVRLAPGCVRVPEVPFGQALIRTLDAQPGVAYVKVFDAFGQTEVPQYDLDSLPTCLDVYTGRVRYMNQLYD